MNSCSQQNSANVLQGSIVARVLALPGSSGTLKAVAVKT